jgi:thiamine-monophosphate kinase
VEGLHFRRDWSGAADVGHKAAAQNLADVAAMGAVPEALLVGLAVPPALPVAWALDLASGLAEEAARAGAYVVGGDLSGASQIVIAVTAMGTMAGLEPVTRSGARPSDVVAVAGKLGYSAAGLALFEAGLAEPAGPAAGTTAGPAVGSVAGVLAAHRRPAPPYAAGPQAAALGATAMIDVSDGLIADLGHIAAASGVRIDIETVRLDVGAPLIAAARALGLDPARPGPAQPRRAQPSSTQHSSAEPGRSPGPVAWVLTGGEDHALVATFPENTVIPAGWIEIGRVYEGGGVWVDGKNYSGDVGWRHFG